MENKRILGYGEVLSRFTPQAYSQLIEQSSNFSLSFAGSESNILANLSRIGHKTALISSLPNNSLGESALRFLSSSGIDTKNISVRDGRIGSYFVEHGHSLRGSKIIYDRLNSCFSNYPVELKTFDNALKNSSHFVLSGITPALSKVCRENILNALEIAKNNKVKIIFDLNFRRNLWDGRDALSFMEKIIDNIDILIGNIGSINDVFGFKSPFSKSFPELVRISEDACNFLTDKYNFDVIALTVRNQIDATQNELGGLIKINNKFYKGKSFEINIKDRLGGGDAFSAGIIHGLIENYSPQQIIDFSNSCFALTQTVLGDLNCFSKSDILEFGSDSYIGHIKR